MDEELQYLEEMIDIKNRRLQVLTKQVSMTGEQSAQPEKVMEIAGLTKEIKGLEQKRRRKVRNADDGNFYSAEELDEIAEKVAKIAELEKTLSIQEGTVKILREVFYWEHQNKKVKAFIGLVLFNATRPFVRLIGDIRSSNLGAGQKLSLTMSVLIAFFTMSSYTWRWIKRDVIGNIRDMETDMKNKREELRVLKAELSKIYKVNEE